ncbi:MAG: DNA-protecting protein DprA, partial [Calditrichaeota bacterium]|nr:DNA-protecting protein DprA [Calditrichota bacterium]
MNRFSLEALLGLYSVPLVGPTKLRKLISVLGSPEAVLNAAYRQLVQIEGIDQKTAERIKQGADGDFVQKQLSKMEEHGVRVLTYWDDLYPDRLKKIYDPPAFLFYKGNLETLANIAIAVVGTRSPTNYGRLITEKFAAVLAQNNFCIISGFARGIDTIAHKTALKNNAPTIAVLGNGLDVVYPPENRELFEEITQKGLVLTEYAMGTRPDAGNFPKRNRIISGISAGVLITEA